MAGHIEPFLLAAQEYCRWAEADPTSESQEAQTAVRLLAALLHYVHELPEGRVLSLP